MRWLAITPPTDVTIKTAVVDDTTVRCAIAGYSRGTVRVGESYPPAPAPSLAALLEGEGPAPITADRLYSERLLFHGPEYQGVRSIDAMAANGIRGSIECLPAPGAVLDNIGQLFGYWVIATARENFLALPLSIDRIELFGPIPVGGERLEGVVVIRSVDDRMVRCDMELVQDDRVLVAVTGWIDRRFDSDEQLWEMVRHADREPISALRPGGYSMVTERWPDSASRELMMRSYLCAEERADYDSRNPKAQRQFLLGRMAAKDALRRWLWDDGEGPIFPIELTIRNGQEGEPVADWTLGQGPSWRDVRVSIAHAGSVGVAVVGHGTDVGIDVEIVEPRSPRFAGMTLADDELVLAPIDADPDAWCTRLWVAKEAAAKATRRGLRGRPKDFVVEAVDGARLRIGDRWIATDRVTAPDGPEMKEYIVAWTD
jgi:phosphopantetheinyl transferase